jgi:hypothetical protein
MLLLWKGKTVNLWNENSLLDGKPSCLGHCHWNSEIWSFFAIGLESSKEDLELLSYSALAFSLFGHKFGILWVCSSPFTYHIMAKFLLCPIENIVNMFSKSSLNSPKHTLFSLIIDLTSKIKLQWIWLIVLKYWS